MRRFRPTAEDETVRRRLLAETLLSTVLESEAPDGESCLPESSLVASVVDSVCAYLGHPKHCPHGRPIPAGPCCRKASRVLEPLVRPLTQLASGDEARIVYVVPAHPDQLVRLSNLGLVPGATIRLQQRLPAFVLAIGETTLAIDPEISGEIYVKKVDA